MNFLPGKYKEVAETFRNDIFMIVSIEASWSKLHEYFNKTDCDTAYVATIILNPLRKSSFFTIRIKRGSSKPTYVPINFGR